MTRGILIAGNGSPLFSAFGVEAAKRVETYAAALIPRIGEGVADSSERQINLEWNPASPLSVRTLTISAVNKMEHIDDAILVCSPPAFRRPVEQFTPGDIDKIIDHNIKGWFFLVRELTALFKVRKAGTLALVLSEVSSGSKDDAPDLLGPAAAAAFRAFAQGILVSAINAPYNVMGFSAEPGEENAFAAHVFKTIDEGKKNLGKWNKYGKLGFQSWKPGIFGR
jgi:NAD(P)-dependent dehydrogenase (short-subunit alcohol dehydrogenase family)